MKYCSFKHASDKKIITGDWTPISPSFDPFAEVEEFCIPCYRWRFLILIRGSFPRWEFLLTNPRNIDGDFPQYYNVVSAFNDFSVNLMRAISRSTHPDSIIRDIVQPTLLLDYLSGGLETEEYHQFAIDLAGMLLNRLNNDGVLESYLSNDQTLFNLFILNEKFDIYRHDPTPINLRQLNRSGVSTIQTRPPETFRWKGPISIYGKIPIIHLENQEIRVPVLIADNFFDPPLDLSDNDNTPYGIRSFFVLNEFHKMWILRESLAQLLEDDTFQNNLYDGLGNHIFTSHLDLSNFDFRAFNIIVDTIDHSISLDQLDFRDETGQAAIIHHLLYQTYPNIVNSFQDRYPCPIMIGQDPNVRYNCPLSGKMGCGMKDRRIMDRQFPRDRIERNVYKFLRQLRDEEVFTHEKLFKITRLHPERLDELNQYSDFWVGNLSQDNNQRWVFEPQMPNYYTLPRISEKKYDVCMVSPICYESGIKIQFISRTDNGSYIVNPVIFMNPWVEEAPFNTGDPIRVIVGQLSIKDFNFNINRQKKQLVRSIQYSSRTVSGLSSSEVMDRILQNRLESNDSRTGMATFGRFARYV